MANTISNNRISNLVSSQLPFFVRNDHPNFITFLEKYYEYLEQNDKVINRIKNIQRYQDIDLTEDEYANKLYSTFLKYIPKDVLADKKILIKHIKDFYRAKGTEKATKFLLRALYDLEIDLYYPKKDILRASDGKWFIQRSLRITDTKIANVSNGNLTGLEKYIGTRIRGNTSNSTALVERVDRFYEQGAQIDELIISNVNGDFVNGEVIYSIFNDVQSTNFISSNIFGGIVNTIEITNSGSLYSVGDPVIIVSNTGVGACATVSSVSTGNVYAIAVYSGGAGYRTNDLLLITGGGGIGANANVSNVVSDNSIHPNTYNIVSSIIELEANTLLNNTVYSNLNSSNVNTSISNAVSYWTYANTGPIRTTLIINPGSNYSTKPDISVIANSVIFQLGILGRMEILDGGQNYAIGDTIEFINVPGGYGTGASANVTNVDTSKSNAINEVKFQSVPGHFIGGSGYDINFLPKVNIISSNGNGANIIVTAILGAGANLVPTTSTIGSIERITITNRGFGYGSNTRIDLTQSGDGTANANVSVIQGVFSYPGRYLNDDGHISSYNFLQDRDYYQIFSYVIKSEQSISKYRQAVKDIIHPAGMKLFGEYKYLNENVDVDYSMDSLDSQERGIKDKTYAKTGNTINVNYISHNLSVNSNVILEFTSGGSNNVRNGIYMIQESLSNYFEVIQRSSLSNITIINPGLTYNSNGYLLFSGGGGTGANASYNINSNGSIVSVTINDPGIGFTHPPTITTNDESFSGNIISIVVSSGGAGFRVDDYLLFSGGGGTGANANVSVVLSDNTVHPNVYTVVSSTISLEANTPLNNTVYSNLSLSNVNTSISGAVNYWTYANTGPVKNILIINAGSDYSFKPNVSIIANSAIQKLGILGRMEIVNGGQNYAIGDTIEFINVEGGYGTGAYGNVTNVDTSKSNAINEVKFIQVTGDFIGGSGYDINYLPKANVVSNTGNGANIVVTAILGTGADLSPKAVVSAEFSADLSYSNNTTGNVYVSVAL